MEASDLKSRGLVTDYLTCITAVTPFNIQGPVVQN